MAAAGRTGMNHFEPVRRARSADIALPCAGSLPDVCRIPHRCIDTGKRFAPSRGCVTQLPGCQIPLTAGFDSLQRLYRARISGSRSDAHAWRGCLSHNARAGGFIRAWPADIRLRSHPFRRQNIRSTL